jgi:tRNA threonylcarbamoyl adenosine modification protein YeaZ
LADPLILAFDTSAAHCAAALLRGGAVLAARVEPMAKGQAERLMPLLEELLAGAGAGWRDLAALGVGIGPGNFTGVRLSVAAARGLALGLGVPAVGVSALEALAFGHAGPRVASLDAKRGAIYLQAFAPEAEAPALVTLDALPLLPAGALCIGHEAAALAAACGGRVADPVLPLAEAIGRLALARYASPQPRPAPLYLRGADAAPAADPPPVILAER